MYMYVKSWSKRNSVVVNKVLIVPGYDLKYLSVDSMLSFFGLRKNSMLIYLGFGVDSMPTFFGFGIRQRADLFGLGLEAC